MNTLRRLSPAALLLSACLAAPAHAIPDGPPVPVAEGTAVAQDPALAARLAYNVGYEHFENARREEAAAVALKGSARKAADAKVRGEFTAARARFEAAAQADPSVKEAWNMLGYTARRLGDYAASLAAYDRALALQPEYPEAIEYRAEAFLGVNRLDDARAAYLRLFASARGHADVLLQAMRRWVDERRARPEGVAKDELERFAAWVEERATVAQQTASLAPGYIVAPSDWH